MPRNQNVLSGLSGMAKTMALPGESKPIRYPSYPALERTAVLALNHSSNYTPATTNNKIMLTRQAAYPLWAESTGVTYVQAFSWTPVSTPTPKLSNVTRMPAGSKSFFPAETYGTFSINYTVTGSWSEPPYDAPIIGLDGGTSEDVWIFVPRATASSFVYNYNGTSQPGDNPILTYERWVSPGESVMETVVIGSQAQPNRVMISIAPTATDRWIRPVRFGVSNGSPSTITMGSTLEFIVATGTIAFDGITVTISNPVPVTMLLPVADFPDFAVTPLPWTSTRVTATSVLLTNTTKALNKEGTILWGRVDPQQHDPFNITSTTVASFHPAEKAFLPLEQGGYTYTMPSTDMSKFVDYTVPFVTSSNVIPVYRLDNTGIVNVGFIQDPDTSNPTNLAVNLDVHLEFRTTSALFQIGMSVAPVEALHQAQIMLLSMGFFFQNEGHQGIITRVLSKAAALHPLMQFMGPMGRGLSGALSIASQLAKSNPHKPQPTTLQTTVRPPNKKKGKKNDAPKPQKKKGGLQMYLDSKKNKRH